MRQQLLTFNQALGRYEIRSSSVLWALLGLRAVVGQHSASENEALTRHARGRRSAVEIGVAEGVSAHDLRAVLGPDADLTLVDPYPPGRVPGINLRWLVAHLHVASARGARVHWRKSYSREAALGWSGAIDFLFIDADHSYDACLEDFLSWSPFVMEHGLVLFHDARVFPGSWTDEATGSVRVVDELFRREGLKGWPIVEEVDSLVVVRRTPGAQDPRTWRGPALP